MLSYATCHPAYAVVISFITHSQQQNPSSYITYPLSLFTHTQPQVLSQTRMECVDPLSHPLNNKTLHHISHPSPPTSYFYFNYSSHPCIHTQPQVLSQTRMECEVPEFVFDRSYTPLYKPVFDSSYITDSLNTGYTCQYVNLAKKNTYATYNLTNPQYAYASPAMYNSGSFQQGNGTWTLMYIRNCEQNSGPVTPSLTPHSYNAQPVSHTSLSSLISHTPSLLSLSNRLTASTTRA